MCRIHGISIESPASFLKYITCMLLWHRAFVNEAYLGVGGVERGHVGTGAAVQRWAEGVKESGGQRGWRGGPSGALPHQTHWVVVADHLAQRRDHPQPDAHPFRVKRNPNTKNGGPALDFGDFCKPTNAIFTVSTKIYPAIPLFSRLSSFSKTNRWFFWQFTSTE